MRPSRLPSRGLRWARISSEGCSLKSNLSWQKSGFLGALAPQRCIVNCPIQVRQSTSSFSSMSTHSLPPLEDGAGQSPLSGFGGVHDVGGLESLMGQPVDISEPSLQWWEQETHALLIAVVSKGLLTTDELRRHIESMDYGNHYQVRSYYCKWATSMALGLIERGVISYTDLDQALMMDGDGNLNNPISKDTVPNFTIGQEVVVRREQKLSRWRKPHLRTPGYIFGVKGIVESYEGSFPDPSYKAFRSLFPTLDESSLPIERKEHLYRVVFQQKDVWPEGKTLGANDTNGDGDTVTVEIYEPWLTIDLTESSNWELNPVEVVHKDLQNDYDDHHHHGHGHEHHEHDHEHLPRKEVEQRAVDLESACLHSTDPPSSSGSIKNSNEDTSLIVGDRLCAALISILSRPQHLGPSLPADIRKTIDSIESATARADGSKLVARAWSDPYFRQRLLDNAEQAAAELGIVTTNSTTATKLKVVASKLPTADEKGIHNLVTCTLCSCYPLSLLGLSPKWYKLRSYRARAVREPRAMLQDSFGLSLPKDRWTIRVHDSTADLRYLVLPPRPRGTKGWSEEDLRSLATRDTMIGVALPSVEEDDKR